MMGGLLGLLGNRQIQEELGLSDEEKEKLRDVGEKVREKLRPLFPETEGGEEMTPEQRRARMEEFRNMSDEEREKLRAEREAAMEKVRKEVEKMTPDIEKEIAEILGRPKFKRLKQIQFQQQLGREGVNALLREDIIQALGLTESEVAQLREVAEGLQKDLDKLREGAGQGFRNLSEEERQKRRKEFESLSEEERQKRFQEMREAGEKMREKGQQLRNDARKKALEIIGDKAAKLREIAGEPFELRRPEFGPGRGRRRPGGGDRPGRGRPRGQR